ncbi:MAG: hypothetical protein AB7N76_03655 [Planctomycetota bacterium]
MSRAPSRLTELWTARPLAAGLVLALVALVAAPLRGQEQDLAGWLSTVHAPPSRGDEALLEWRRREPFLNQRLGRIAADEGAAPRAREGALHVLAVVAESLDLFPAPARLPASLAEVASAARARAVTREAVLSLLSRAADAQTISEGLPPEGPAELLELLSDPLWLAPPERRLRAVRCAAGLSGALATAALWDRLRDPERGVRAAAAEGLAARGALAALERALPVLLAQGDVEAGMAALEQLARARGARPLDLCRDLLRDEATSDEARAALALALARLRWGEAEGALRRLAREERRGRQARAAARAALVILDPSRADEELLAALVEDATAPERERAEAALEGLEAAPAVALTAPLRAQLRTADPQGARRARLAALCEVFDLEALVLDLGELAQDESQAPAARQAAVHALGRLGGDERSLLTLAGSAATAAALRREAVDALARRARERASVAARVALEQALGDAESTVRRAALRGLIALGDQRGAAPLERAPEVVRRPEEARLWVEAARSLGEVEPRRSTWVLGLWRARPALRADAALGLETARYARALPPALGVPALLDLLEHPAAAVSATARVALVQRFQGSSPASPGAWREAWAKRPKEFR